MKARIINTPVEVEVQPYFNEGMFSGFTDVSGRLRPGMVVYKPSDLEFIDKPAPLEPIVDWDEFRREAAKVAMCQLIGMGRDDGYKYSPDEVAHYAIVYADELIRQLKEVGK